MDLGGDVMGTHRRLTELDRAILAYLREHGPSSTAEMRGAGLALEHGTMRRLHDEGLVRRKLVGSRGSNKYMWGLM